MFKSGAAFGIFLAMAAFLLLFWNEGRAVKTARALAEGVRHVVAVTTSLPDSQHDKALVHVSGQASTPEMLQDPLLQLETQAFKLKRKVEMYQWAQLTSQEDQIESWYYEPQWSETRIDSSDFSLRYQNPKTMPYSSETFIAEQVKVGDFQLSSSLINKLSNFEPHNLQFTPETLASIFGHNDISTQGNNLYIPYGQGTTDRPEIGDVRITLEHVPLSVVSIVAQQHGAMLEPYLARSGGTIALIKTGSFSADEMFDSAVKQNNALTAFLRLFGFGLMATGIRLLFRPLTAMAGFVPILGSIVRFGAIAVAGVLAFVLSLITAAIAWFSYRPLIALPLLLVAAASFYLARQAGKNRPARNVTLS